MVIPLGLPARLYLSFDLSPSESAAIIAIDTFSPALVFASVMAARVGALLTFNSTSLESFNPTLLLTTKRYVPSSSSLIDVNIRVLLF